MTPTLTVILIVAFLFSPIALPLLSTLLIIIFSVILLPIALVVGLINKIRGVK